MTGLLHESCVQRQDIENEELDIWKANLLLGIALFRRFSGQICGRYPVKQEQHMSRRIENGKKSVATDSEPTEFTHLVTFLGVVEPVCREWGEGY